VKRAVAGKQPAPTQPGWLPGNAVAAIGLAVAAAAIGVSFISTRGLAPWLPVYTYYTSFADVSIIGLVVLLGGLFLGASLGVRRDNGRLGLTVGLGFLAAGVFAFVVTLLYPIRVNEGGSLIYVQALPQTTLLISLGVVTLLMSAVFARLARRQALHQTLSIPA